MNNSEKTRSETFLDRILALNLGSDVHFDLKARLCSVLDVFGTYNPQGMPKWPHRHDIVMYDV